MKKLKYKLYQFLSGRYGIDQLGKFLMILIFTIYILNLFLLQNTILYFINLILIIYYITRVYSRKIYARQRENFIFLQLVNAPLQRKATLLQKQKDDPYNKYYRCKKCKQIVRVPKGRGKITITCPKCQTRFDKRT